jgi:zinc protease
VITRLVLTFLALPLIAFAQAAIPEKAQSPSKPAVQEKAPASPAAKAPVKAAAAAALPSYRDLKYPPLRQIELPKIESLTLPNGMQVMLLENHTLPLVRGTALVRTGNLFDPPAKVGLATVTGVAIRAGGTKTKDGDQLDEQLENIAANVESSIDESYGTVSFSCLKENTAEVLGIFHDILTAPEFRIEKIDLAKNQIRSGISRRNDESSGIASREFAGIVYGKNNSYGWDIQYATVDKIQRDDVVEFYKRYFFPANIILAVQGDFSAPEMKANLEKIFTDWTYTQEKVPAFPTVTKQSSAGTYLVTKTDVTQTNFILGQTGGMLNDKDYPALEVLSDILGGGFHSRLFQIVRTRLGNAYSISSDWGAGYDHPGLFTISGSTKSASTTDTFKVILKEVDRIRTEPVSNEELEIAKNQVQNSFIFRLDTPAKTLNRLLIYKYFGYPDDFIFRYQKAISALTPSDILRVAKERIDPKSFTLLAVGNPKDFMDPLSTLGSSVRDLDITIPAPKAQVAEAGAESLAAGNALLQKVQQAVGGADKLAAVKDLTFRITTKIDPSQGGISADQVNQWLTPKHFRQDATYPFGKQSVYFDGNAGWMAAQQNVVSIADAPRAQLKGELFRVYVPLLLSDRVPDRKVNLVTPGVLEISDADGMVVRVTVDPQTNFPIREEYPAAGQKGSAMVSSVFSDFSPVAGIQVPHKWTISQNGKKFADVTLTDAKFNTGLKAEVLSRQP